MFKATPYTARNGVALFFRFTGSDIRRVGSQSPTYSLFKDMHKVSFADNYILHGITAKAAPYDNLPGML